MQITLREISSASVRAVPRLAVKPEQQGFVASNAISLAEALFSDEAWYRAIYADDELVEFLMLSDESLKKVPPSEPKIDALAEARAGAPIVATLSEAQG